MNIYTENLKTRRNFIARRDFRRCAKEQKTSLSHTFFKNFYVVHFPINFSFVTSYTEGILPNPRTSRNRRTPSLIHGISKMYGPYNMYIFYKIRKFSAFYFTWVVLRKKKHMTRGGVRITLNCLSYELGASLNNISVFLQPKDIS